MPTGKFYIGSDSRIDVLGLADEDGVFLDGRAVVTADLLTKPGGAVVEGGAGIQFAYVEGSNGDFVGNLPATAKMKPGKTYTLEVVAVYDAATLTVTVEREAGYVVG